MKDWDKFLGHFCRGIAQGVKLAESENPYKIGQHTEAIRTSVLGMARQLPDEKRDELIAALALIGIDMDLTPPWQAGEGGSKP